MSNENQQSEAPRITVQDIAQARQIIDIAVKRGAFEGNEISAVGAQRDRLAQFEDYHRKQQEEQEAAEGQQENPESPKEA